MKASASQMDERVAIAVGWTLAVAVALAFVGGCGIPSAHTISRNYGLREDVPVDPPREPGAYADDCAAGGHLFKLYCGSCHNARPLGERPFNNYQVAIAHMRSQAYLTGKEYRQIILFLRRWDNVGPPTAPTPPSPKRLIFSQPVSEAGTAAPAPAPGQASAPAAPPPPPTAGAAGPWQRPQTVAAPAPAPASAPAPAAPRPLTELPAPMN
jgi:hypothetical protein